MTIPASPAEFERLVLRLLARTVHNRVVVQYLIPRGYRSDWAGVVAIGDGADRIFVKARRGRGSIQAMKRERDILERLPAGFGPTVRNWCYSPADNVALLVLEDLSGNRWPPPWSAEDIRQTRNLLNRMTTIDLAFESMPRLADIASRMGNWTTIAAAPEPFLATGLRPARWLDFIMPVVTQIDFSELLDGERLVHFDVRSDNVCFDSADPVLVDWADCCLGNPRIDFLSWLPSLRMEGGPEPWLLAPDAELGHVAFLAGYWSSQAGLPEPASARGLRRLQRSQASVALDWLDICLSAS